MNAELHPPRRARRGNQEALIAWLDEQERILRMRGHLIDSLYLLKISLLPDKQDLEMRMFEFYYFR